MLEKTKFRTAVAIWLGTCMLFSPALAGAANGRGIEAGEVYPSEITVDGQVVGTMTSQAFNIAGEGEDEVALLLPTTAQGLGSEGFTPITVDDVAAYLNWSGKSASQLAEDLEKAAVPLRWYLEMARSFDDAAEADQLFRLLGNLGQNTGENEYQAFYEFLDLTGISASAFSAALTDQQLSLESLFDMLREGKGGFTDLAGAYTNTDQSLEELINYSAEESVDSTVIGALISAIIQNIILPIAIAVGFKMGFDELGAHESGVHLASSKGFFLKEHAKNPMLYTGGTRGQSKMIGWAQYEPDGKTLGASVAFSVSDVYGATLTGSETLGGLFFPYIGVTIHQANADNAWSIYDGKARFKAFRGNKPHKVENTTVNGKVVPILYLQVNFTAQKGRNYHNQLFTFKVRGDQAPFLLQ